MHYKNLSIIGTSHIAAQSLKEVEEAIIKEKPDIIDKIKVFHSIHIVTKQSVLVSR